MLQSAPLTSRAAPQPPTGHRFRAGWLLMAVLLVALIVAVGQQWNEGPAMILGELIGLIAPLAAFALAAFLLHAIWNRFASR